MTLQPLLDMSPSDAEQSLTDFLAARGEEPYRARQILSWVYEHRATSFADMSSLPAPVRTALADEYSLTLLSEAFSARSRDGTLKHLWALDDGEQVESVLIPVEGRVTLCISSQVGCALGCGFCATGMFGFRRQLSAAEIAAQFREADGASRRAFGRPVSNLVYMGMGEPFANADAVFTSLSVIHGGFGFGARRITVSTVGLIPGIRRLAARPEAFRLAVSLHAPNHELRMTLVPIEQRYPLPELFEALRDYQKIKNRRITFEYTLIEGINDSVELADQLADISTGLDVFVNLIPLNPVPGIDLRPSPRRQVDKFRMALEARGIPAAVRQPRGRDIAAACGQLRLERDAAATSR
ncbi:MAG: 23S rRNA (adenine(2503)-C(2))-methyltransferase RlmN [Gemmatimonadota bacterium]